MATTALDSAAPRLPPETSGDPAVTADAAIARVLTAERDARAAVAECAVQAERELQAGRERARTISARGAGRVSFVQRSTERQLADARARIAAERAALAEPAVIVHADRRLADAVGTLADELTRGALASAAGNER